jgi:D-alanine-D-alanine ligase
MRRLRVLAVVDGRQVPPEDAAGVDPVTADWRTEYDVVGALRRLGHDVHVLGVGSDLRAIGRTVDEYRPHIVFNLLEDVHDVPIYDQNLVSYLELLRVPYTGCNPRGLMLARDKAIAKALLAHHGVPVPEFVVFPRGRAVGRPRGVPYPAIVKSLTKEGSEGLAQSSIVDSDARLAARVRFVHERLATDAIAERYVDGRELYVGILGNHRLQVLPIWELRFTNLPADARPIATARAKWNAAYQRRRGIASEAAGELPEPLAERIRDLCRRAYRVLRLSGCARIDLRLDRDGRVWVLEANPNPQLADGEDLARSAERAGVPYPALITRLLELGLRWSSRLNGA